MRANSPALMLLALTTCVFIAAAASAKSWAMSPSWGKIVLTLALYSGGNLIMLRLIKLAGMGVAFSLSAVLQLIAVNGVAVLIYGERLGLAQGAGVVLAVAAVALISFGSPQP